MKTIVLTRPVGKYSQISEFSSELEKAGYSVYQLPVLTIVPRPFEEFRGIAERTLRRDFDWIVFSSPAAVGVFRDLLSANFPNSSLPDSVMVAAQGTATAAACRELFNKTPEVVPTAFVAEDLAAALNVEFLRKGSSPSVLHPGSTGGRDVIARELEKLGIYVERVGTYATSGIELGKEDLAWIKAQVPHSLVFVFMSPSAVRATIDALTPLASNLLRDSYIVSVGPITSKELRDRGLLISIEAHEHSGLGVVKALNTFTESL